MKTFIVAVLMVAALGLAAAADPIHVYDKQEGNFTVSDISMTTTDGHWSAGAVATVTITGQVKKLIKAGVVKFKIYELSVQHFVFSDNDAYFECTNKGCDQRQPIALDITDPFHTPSQYTLTYQFVMPAAQKTGVFRMVVWGEDQDHFPHDFDVVFGYNFTSGAPTESFPAMDTTAVADSLVAPSPSPKFTWKALNANFTVNSVDMTSSTGAWEENATATVVVKGTVPSLELTAGTLKWKLYELYVKSFVSSGNRDYFHCNNKGCDLSNPLALTLDDVSARPTNFTLTFSFDMLKAQTTGDFTLVAWGVDNTHEHDFDLSIGFNY